MGELRAFRESGAAMVEAVIALPLFLFIVFVSIEFMILSWRALSLQFIATQAMRTLVTGMCENADTGEPEYCEEEGRRVAYVTKQSTELSRTYGLGAHPELKLCLGVAGQGELSCGGSDRALGLTTTGTLIEVKTSYESPLLFRMIQGDSSGSEGGDANAEYLEKFKLVGISVGRIEGRPREE